MREFYGWRIKMGKYQSFEELKNARLKAYNGMREGDVLGFLDQHTGFYPDPAHFIYELLQNAEDMEATEVKFNLLSDKLIFEHNGTKRDFDLDDIDAITNKNKSPKADDPTQIGKFGMGFKAVYIYTNTPEIHSGKFDFRIKNIIIPDDEDVPKLAMEHFTQFIFPFDNPEKSANDAVKEIIEEGFYKLSETALLFLSHIETIRYYLPDGYEGCISIEHKICNIRFLDAITVKKPSEDKTITYWARFSDECPLMVKEKDSNNRAVKLFPVSIAYRLIKNNNKFSLDSSLAGKVCLFFPTEMDSLLHFHINAPFASTVARDVILSKGEDGEANDKLISKLADLTAESLHWLKKAKMLDYAAYSTLPTLRDYSNQPNSRYKIFATRIKEEFEHSELFITDDGNYYSIGNIFNAANKDIKTIMPANYLEKLYNKSWIPTVPSVTRIEYFIDQFDIKEYSIENFIDSLEKDYTFFDELFAEQKNDEYFKTLYFLFSQSKDREINKYYGFLQVIRPTRNEILHRVKFLMCEDGKLHSVQDTLFLKTAYQPKYYIKNPIYINITFKSSSQDRAIRQFLISLGVKEMCEREDLIADVSGENVPVDDMILKVMEIIEGYKNSTIDINEFSDVPIFVASNGDGKLYRVKAKECCWDTASAFFFRNTQYTLSQNHYKVIEDDLPTLKEIFKNLGGKTNPIFEDIFLFDSHPQFNNLKKLGIERGDTRTRRDYGIAEFSNLKDLSSIKDRNLKESSLLLWQQVLKEKDRYKLQATYRANGSVEFQYLESSLVYYLKRIAWVPTVSGEYKCPYELKEDDLLEEFKYEKPSVLLAAISVKPNDLVEQLKSNGVEDENTLFFAGCDADEQQLAREFIENLRKGKHKTGKSLTELATTSDRDQSPEVDEDDDFGEFHKPKNLDKRRLKLEKEFDDREEPQTSIKKLQFVLEKPGTEEKTFVRNEYHGHCQICGNEGILTSKGKRYFEAINIFNTGKLDESLQLNLGLGWNTLSLCPNCAAKFKYSQITISSLIEQAQHIDINAAQSSFFDISINLEGKPTTIRFTPKHLLALQVAIKKIKEIEKSDDKV